LRSIRSWPDGFL